MGCSAFCRGISLALATLFVATIVILLIIDCRSIDFYRERGRLIFREEFDEPLKTDVWQHIIAGKNERPISEFVYYMNYPENSYVKDGLLHIRPTLTADRFGEEFLKNGTLDLENHGCDLFQNKSGCYIIPGVDIINPVESARIRTTDKLFNFTYGTLEIRAKMPRGDWISTAIRLLPYEIKFTQWPVTGEIVVAKVRGNDYFECDGKPMGNTLMESTMIFGRSLNEILWRGTHYEATLEKGDFSSEFHLFGIQRTPHTITFFIDGKIVGRITPPPDGFNGLAVLDEYFWERSNGNKMAPFNKPLYLEFSVSVGGDFAPDCQKSEPSIPWDTNEASPMRSFWENKEHWLPSWRSHDSPKAVTNALQIDYIRLYDYNPNVPKAWSWFPKLR